MPRVGGPRRDGNGDRAADRARTGHARRHAPRAAGGRRPSPAAPHAAAGRDFRPPAGPTEAPVRRGAPRLDRPRLDVARPCRSHARRPRVLDRGRASRARGPLRGRPGPLLPELLRRPVRGHGRGPRRDPRPRRRAALLRPRRGNPRRRARPRGVRGPHAERARDRAHAEGPLLRAPGRRPVPRREGEGRVEHGGRGRAAARRRRAREPPLLQRGHAGRPQPVPSLLPRHAVVPLGGVLGPGPRQRLLRRTRLLGRAGVEAAAGAGERRARRSARRRGATPRSSPPRSSRSARGRGSRSGGSRSPSATW